MTVDYKEYMADKQEFFGKHHYDFQCETSSMNEYGIYYKTYIFHDGAIWYERMAPAYVETSVRVRGVECKVTVKLFETEYWNTEHGSKVYYEQF